MIDRWKKEKKISLAYNKIFSSEEGKTVLADLIDVAKVTGDVNCEMEEGARRICLYIMKKARLKNLRQIEDLMQHKDELDEI